MSDVRDLLERKRQEAVPPPDAFERLVARRQQRGFRRRVSAVAIALTVASAGIGWAVVAFHRSGPRHPGQPAAATWRGVPLPPSRFALKVVPWEIPNRGTVLDMLSSPPYLKDALREAGELMDFYRGVMPKAGWIRDYDSGFRSVASSGFLQNSLAGIQVWSRRGDTVRLYVSAGPANPATLGLVFSKAPVSVATLQRPIQLGRSNRTLSPAPDAAPRVDAEEALHRAWIDFVGATASRIEVKFGRLSTGTSTDRLVWLVTYRDALLPAPEGPGPAPQRGSWNVVIDSTTGDFVLEFNS